MFFPSWWCMQPFLFVTVMFTALSIHQSRQSISKELLIEILTVREPSHCPSDGLLVDHLGNNSVRWECILFKTNSTLSTYKLLLLSLYRSSYHVYLNAGDFSLNLVPKYVELFNSCVWSAKHLQPDCAEPNQGPITKSCRQNRAWVKLTDPVFFFFSFLSLSLSLFLFLGRGCCSSNFFY